jgi:hypothetical protein
MNAHFRVVGERMGARGRPRRGRRRPGRSTQRDGGAERPG